MSDTYIGIAEAPVRGMVAVRGDFADPAFAATVKDITGAELAAKLGVTGTAHSGSVWMSPDEALVFVAAGQGAATADDLGAAFVGRHAMALDVSDARLVFRLTGTRVGEVLAKGAPCDCSDHGVPVGTARRSHLGGLAVAFWRLEPEVWEITCFRSYAHHLDAWLRATAAVGSEVGFG